MDFQKLFTESKGQPIIYQDKEIKLIDRINLSNNMTKLKLSFLKTNSVWEQGVILEAKGYFDVNDERITNKIVLWESTAPKELEFIIQSKDKILIIYNVWKTEDGTIHYWVYGGAMHVEENNGIKTYNCNDGFPDDDFNDIVFQIELI